MSAARPESQGREADPSTVPPWDLGRSPAWRGPRQPPRPRLPFGRGLSPGSRRAAYRVAAVRRVVAAVLAGVAVWTAVRVLAPQPPADRVTAVTAARDLAAGTVLGTDDLTVVLRASAELPAESAREPSSLLGQALAGPVTAGEVLTPVRLRGRGMLTGRPSGEVAVGIPLADATLVPSLRIGDSVSVHGAGAPDEITRGTVLAVHADDGASLISRRGASASVVLAVPGSGAIALAAGMAGPGAGFLLALHR